MLCWGGNVIAEAATPRIFVAANLDYKNIGIILKQSRTPCSEVRDAMAESRENLISVNLRFSEPFQHVEFVLVSLDEQCRVSVHE
jgi:hypothetical protein